MKQAPLTGPNRWPHNSTTNNPTQQTKNHNDGHSSVCQSFFSLSTNWCTHQTALGYSSIQNDVCCVHDTTNTHAKYRRMLRRKRELKHRKSRPQRLVVCSFVGDTQRLDAVFTRRVVVVVTADIDHHNDTSSTGNNQSNTTTPTATVSLSGKRAISWLALQSAAQQRDDARCGWTVTGDALTC